MSKSRTMKRMSRMTSGKTAIADAPSRNNDNRQHKAPVTVLPAVSGLPNIRHEDNNNSGRATIAELSLSEQLRKNRIEQASITPVAVTNEGTVTFFNSGTSSWTTVVERSYSHKFPISNRITVTPEWAFDVLSNRNFSNRKIDRRRVKKYTQDIIDNKWYVSNDDICFLKDGTLANGQHRLTAIVEAMASVEMSFKFGISKESIVAIDEGRTRSNLDVIRIMGVPGNNITLSATNYILEQTGKKHVMPRHEILEFNKRHFEAAMFAAQLTKKPIARGPVHAALIRAWYTVNRDRLQQFIDILQSGEGTGRQEDVAAIRLREYVIKHSNDNSGPGREETYRKAETAIEYFTNHTPLAKLYARNEELFNLPEEIVQR